ncbi:O-antigen ligase family protein [Emticicia sp. C21]|uniref:O-antigen ligase family protein n=1 Tax=Emticicia sp. C21 TaxID=2302915 RepID=UPI000E34447A|nr:O-antigen ligase family protein [Emticicia sp. C21]RFS17235.1 hypothetical protein D0T08_05500 [Emticicia sp. C21]
MWIRFIYILFVLSFLNALFRRYIGELNFNFFLYILYFFTTVFGLLSLFSFRHSLREFKAIFIVTAFSVIYVLSVSYTISNTSYDKIILIGLLPFYVLCALGAVHIDRDLKLLFSVWFCVLTLYTIYAIYILIQENFIFSTFYKRLDIIDYLTYSLLALSFSLYSLIFSKNILFKLGTIVFFSFSLISGARAPVVFFLLLLFYWIVKKRMYSYVFISMILITGLFFLYWDELNMLIEFAFIRFSSFGEDNSTSERVSFLEKSLNSFLEYPLFGQGINSSGLILIGIDEKEYPHNFLLEILIEIGILGIIPMLCYLLLMVEPLLFKRRKFNNMQLFLSAICIFIFANFMKSFSIIDLKYLLFFLTYFASYNKLYL